MAQLWVIRHGQASFGAENYDKLSELGHLQSQALGAWFERMGWAPDRVITGTMTRHDETRGAMGLARSETHEGFNEYDFADLLAARYGGAMPAQVKGDRKAHFRALRDTVLMWQRGELDGVRESWTEFSDRVEKARLFACQGGSKHVLVISSGGVIGALVARCLEAPAKMMMTLNLQVKNTSITRFVFSGERMSLDGFNAAPHIDDQPELLSYS